MTTERSDVLPTVPRGDSEELHPREFRFGRCLFWAAGAAASFDIAYGFPQLSFVIVGYLYCLIQLSQGGSGRLAFYFGLAVGLLTAAPQLHCFWSIFGPSAIALWVVVAFWIGLFVALARLCKARFGPRWGLLLIPFLWTGLEYFRSELYYLRFSWLNVGYAFSGSVALLLFKSCGMYGAGFLAMAVAVGISLLRPEKALPANQADVPSDSEPKRQRTAALQDASHFSERAVPPQDLGMRLCSAALVLLALFAFVSLTLHGRPSSEIPTSPSEKSIQVAGLQLESATEAQVVSALDNLLRSHPEAELLMLSEYTLDGPVPDMVTTWCREHHRHLILGGKDPAPKNNFYDTAFVVGPTGEIIFRQVKSVPIQFFKDGLPATEQKLWESPWGKIGLCICYDLSYTRVTDALIRQGAQAIIVPTMDVVDWGRREHQLHALVAPVRAAEYGVPIFRVASSGISQLVDRTGQVVARAGFPGQQETLAGQLTLGKAGTLPLDRWLAPVAVGVTAIVMLWLLVRRLAGKVHPNLAW